MFKTVIVVAAVAVLSSALLAEEHFGVKVYPNVKTDASTVWYCKQFAPESERQAGLSASWSTAAGQRISNGISRQGRPAWLNHVTPSRTRSTARR